MDYLLELVIVPVTDVDRAKAFYADVLGFTVDLDVAPRDGVRIVQMTPKGSACSITIGTGLTGMAPGSLEGLQLSVADIEAAHADLTARGAGTTAIQHFEGSGFVDGKGEDWNSFLFFSDPDGNRWAIQESPRLRAMHGSSEDGAIPIADPPLDAGAILQATARPAPNPAPALTPPASMGQRGTGFPGTHRLAFSGVVARA